MSHCKENCFCNACERECPDGTGVNGFIDGHQVCAFTLCLSCFGEFLSNYGCMRADCCPEEECEPEPECEPDPCELKKCPVANCHGYVTK
jgi:hypothetical protein